MRPGLLRNAVFIVLTSWLISSCGGGSGSEGGLIGGGGDDGAGGGAEPPEPTLTVRLVREVDGTEVDVDRVDPSNPATIVATIGNSSENAIIQFDTTIGNLDPEVGQVLSRDGEARIRLLSGNEEGPGSVSASASIDGTTVNSNVVLFDMFAEDVEENEEQELQLGALEIDLEDSPLVDGIPPQGSARISVIVQDVATTPATPVPGVDVTFSSRCTGTDEASIGSGESGADGIVSVIYQAEGCEGNDPITATIPSLSGVTSSDTIFVFPPGATDIRFEAVQNSAGDDITTIFISESGGDSTARVIFRVLDSFGDPKEDVDVRFSLTTTVGGLALENAVRQSDEDGLVVAFVNAGFFPTTVNVRATIDVDQDNNGVTDGTKSTLSTQLSVNTGIADQDSMSISATVLNVEGENIDGNTTEINVRMADLANNPVRDGTTVQFRTEYGSIQPSCNMVGGVCSVTWTTQQPRRPLDPNKVTPTLFDQLCPSRWILDEALTISGADGLTGYLVGGVGRVEVADDDTALAFETDFTVNVDGTGITCDEDSTLCVDGAELRISYQRAWLDEDPPVNGDTEHTISTPGTGTSPFTNQTGVPCTANYFNFFSSARNPSVEAPAYFGGMGQVYGGRSTVLAFAQGEESFTDANSNGRYDEGEPFIDLPEAFLDVNEDGVYGNGNPAVDDSSNNTPENWNCYGPVAPLSPNNPPLNRCFQTGGEEDILVDFNEDGLFNEGNGIYNGTLCPEIDTATGQPPTYCTRDLVNIRRSIPILSAGSSGFISVRDSSYGELIGEVDLRGDPAAGFLDAPGATVTTNGGAELAPGADFTVGFNDDQVPPGIGELAYIRSGSGGVQVAVSDLFNGRMPSGTSISVDPGVCEITGTDADTVGSSSGFGFTQFGFGLGPIENPPTDSGTVLITVTSPGGAGQGGVTTQRSFSCSY